jgi:hypothetical protein
MTGLTGTFSHMAPEVFTATASYSEKADIFSAAVCMVFLVSGERAYSGELAWFDSRPDLLARRVALEGYRAPLESAIKNKQLRDLLTRMWAQEASARPSATQCEEELVALLAKTERNKAKFLLNPIKEFTRALSFSSPSFSPTSVLMRTFSFSPTSPLAASPSREPESPVVAQPQFSQSLKTFGRSQSVVSPRTSLDSWSCVNIPAWR